MQDARSLDSAKQQQQEQQQQQQLPQQRVDHVEESEESEYTMASSGRTIFDLVYETVEMFAATSIGQFVIERADRALKTVEDTAKWSLPQDASSDHKLRRPLPWVPFLMMIIALRLVRIWVSLAALLIGDGPITARDMVYFVQTRRRKLRATRFKGLKVLRQQESESTVAKSDSSTTGLIGTLRRLLSRAICRPGLHAEPGRQIFVYSSKQQVSTSSRERQSVKRPRDEDLSDHGLSFTERLAKYADNSSDDGSDYVPNPEDYDDDDDDTTSSGTNYSSDELIGKDNNQRLSSETEEARSTSTNQHSAHAERSDVVENGSGNGNGNGPSNAGSNGNGNRRQTIPKRVIPTKKVEEQQHMAVQENGPQQSGMHHEADVAKVKSLTAAALNGDKFPEMIKSESSAKTQLKGVPTMNPTATAGSPPPDFSTFVLHSHDTHRPAMLRQSTQVGHIDVGSTLTPPSSDEPAPKKLEHHLPPQTSRPSSHSQNQHHNYHQQNRFRGNRRR